jgi:4-hydroxybutyryl-CoA dehydratase/vinylacetyl-CoA-Delta-isomerase
MDKKQSTGGDKKRFLRYLEHDHDSEITCYGAMTDFNGDRSLPPHIQPDPGQYVHVVEERKNGIVVRGAKEHQTGAVNSNEIITIGTVAVDYLEESMHGNGSPQA